MQPAASLTAVFQTSFLEPSRRPAVAPPRRGFDFYDRRERPRLELSSGVCAMSLLGQSLRSFSALASPLVRCCPIAS
jgi:hypothetical protein